jgi:hypothetical protein
MPEQIDATECHHWTIRDERCLDCGAEFVSIPIDDETAKRLKKAFGLDQPRIRVNWPDPETGLAGFQSDN